MIKAVENAAVICCFISKEYEDCPYCKLELEYAQNCHKRIIPCILTDRKVWEPSPDRWLCIITKQLIALDFSDTTEKNIHTKVSKLIEVIQNESAVDTTESIHPSVKLFESVRCKYIENNQIKHIGNKRSFSMERSYVNLVITEIKEEQGSKRKIGHANKSNHQSSPCNSKVFSMYEEVCSAEAYVEKIFGQCEGQKKKLLMLGRAGVGKSTLCQYLTYRWAKGELWSEYELIVLIRLGSLIHSRCPPLNGSQSVKHYSLVDLLEQEYFSYESLTKEDKKCFKEQCRKGHVLWILDGYDEIAHSIPEQLKDVFNQLLETQHHILTSRPYVTVLSYDVKIGIKGFTDDNVIKYVEQFFDQIKYEIMYASFAAQKLLRYLKSYCSIWEIAHTPVNLELICSLWINNNYSEMRPITMTILYDAITQRLCWCRLTENDINLSLKTEKRLDAQCHHELEFLESLAFNAMEYNTKILSEEHFQKTLKDTKYLLEDNLQLLNIGILESSDERPIINQVQSQKQYYFVHASFQEFFAARHLVKALKSTNSQKATTFINNYKYDQRFASVFIFAAGLLAQSNYQSNMDTFWSTLHEQPCDLIGLKHVKLIIECIAEFGEDSAFLARIDCLNSIVKWLKICVCAKPLIIAEYFLQSLQCTTSLANESVVQNKIIALFQTQDKNTKLNLCKIISKLTISDPDPSLISVILTIMQDEDPFVREMAFAALENMGEKATTNKMLTSLMNAIQDKDWYVRRNVIKILGNMGVKAAKTEVIDSLMNALRDREWRVREVAHEALGNIAEQVATNEMTAGLMNTSTAEECTIKISSCPVFENTNETVDMNEVISGLLNALRDKNSFIRETACETIGRFGEKAATSEVISGLVGALWDEVSNVKCSACITIGNMGMKAATSEVISGLLNALRDEDSYVRENACSVLQSMGEKSKLNEVIVHVVNALWDDDLCVRKSARTVLRNMGEKVATNEMITCLTDGLRDKNSDVRESACAVLGSMGGKAATAKVIECLLTALWDDDWIVRESACESLGNMGANVVTDEMITGLLNALQDEDSCVRQSACEALGRIDRRMVGIEIINALLEALRDENSFVREVACRTIGNMDEKVVTNEIINVLADVLRDEESNVRRSACEALERLGENVATNEVIVGLVNTLQDENSFVRETACKTLGIMGMKTARNEVIVGLINALNNEDSYVRWRAREAIDNIGEKGPKNQLLAELMNTLRDIDPHTRQGAIESLERMGEKAATNEIISGLVNTLSNENWGVRQAACEAFKNMGEKAATKKVIASLVHVLEDENLYVRRSAIKTLSYISGKTATNEIIDSLVSALQNEDWTIRKIACIALGNISEEIATDKMIAGLVNAFSDEESHVRRNAIKALMNMGEKAATAEVIACLMQALHDEDWAGRKMACKALGKMGEKVASSKVLVDLLKVLRDEDLCVRRSAAKALMRMGQEVATSDVISDLVDSLADQKINIDDILAADVLEWALCSYSGIKKLDSHVVSKLYSYIRRNKEIRCTRIPPDQFFRVFLETRISTWLPLCIYVALIQGSAVTIVENSIVVYGSKESVELLVPRRELFKKLVKAFQRQGKELETDSFVVWKSEAVATKRSKVCELM